MSEQNNQPDTESKYSLIDFTKERSTQTKVGIAALVGGIAVELTGIVVHSVDNLSSKTNEIFNQSTVNDLKLAGLLSIIAGSTIIANRINRKSN